MILIIRLTITSIVQVLIKVKQQLVIVPITTVEIHQQQHRRNRRIRISQMLFFLSFRNKIQLDILLFSYTHDYFLTLDLLLIKLKHKTTYFWSLFIIHMHSSFCPIRVYRCSPFDIVLLSCILHRSFHCLFSFLVKLFFYHSID